MLFRSAMFPFQKDRQGTVTWDASFTLEVRFPSREELLRLRKSENERRKKSKLPLLPEYVEDIALDVESALWAWVNFGGLGARTRRGCGALFCQGVSPTDNGISQWYREKLNAYDIMLPDSNSPREWATLPRELLVHAEIMPPQKAWNAVIELLRDFRQGTAGRNRGNGRSRWPEADSIRRITGQSDPRHRTSITTSKDAFPKAEFGLPIIFQFKDNEDPKKYRNHGRDDRRKNENIQLFPKKSQRMASPIVLKPLLISETNALQMVIKLNTVCLNEVILE